MKPSKWMLSILLFLIAVVPSGHAQEAPAGFADEFMMHFNTTARKFEALAEAMPAEAYAWSPGEGVMSVERVYMHIARYNYMYPSQNLGMDLPEGIDLDTMESITGKGAVMEHPRASNEYVRRVVESMDTAALERTVRLYGRDVPAWAVLFQHVSHMKEHLGQSIAYARMNDVPPPWSR